MAYQSRRRNLFTQDKKKAFCEYYAKTGRFNYSARMINQSPQTVRNHLADDEEFKAMLDEADRDYSERVRAKVQELALEGQTRGVWYQGERVGEEKVISEKMLELEAKRVDPGYRDKGQLDLNHSGKIGGVLVVTGTLTEEEWEAQPNDAVTAPQPE